MFVSTQHSCTVTVEYNLNKLHHHIQIWRRGPTRIYTGMVHSDFIAVKTKLIQYGTYRALQCYFFKALIFCYTTFTITLLFSIHKHNSYTLNIIKRILPNTTTPTCVYPSYFFLCTMLQNILTIRVLFFLFLEWTFLDKSQSCWGSFLWMYYSFFHSHTKTPWRMHNSTYSQCSERCHLEKKKKQKKQRHVTSTACIIRIIVYHYTEFSSERNKNKVVPKSIWTLESRLKN